MNKSFVVAVSAICLCGGGIAHAAPEPVDTAKPAPTFQPAPPEKVAEFERNLNELNVRLDSFNQVPLESLTLGVWPGLTNSVPTAYGAPPGGGGIGVVYQNRTRSGARDDASMGVVLGIGEPDSKSSVDVGINVFDMSSKGAGNFGDRGSFNVKIHHSFSGGKALAVGLENFGNWGLTDSPRSYYAAYSFRTGFLGRPASNKPFSVLYTTVGLGSGRFLSNSDIVAGKGGMNVFGSLTTNISRQANILAEWSGQDINLGASIVPFKKWPIVVTPAIADVTKRGGNKTRFVLSVGYGFSVSTNEWAH